VLRAADILELFLGPDGTLTAAEIIERLGPKLLERLKQRKLTALTPHSITSRTVLLAQLKEVRAHGVAHGVGRERRLGGRDEHLDPHVPSFRGEAWAALGEAGACGRGRTDREAGRA